MNKDNKERDFEAVVVFFVKDGKVRLARKKDKIGEGLWNGYGGEIEPRDHVCETINLSPEKVAAVREVSEEAGIVVLIDDLRLVGLGHITNVRDDGSEFLCVLWVLVSRRWFGRFKVTSEMGASKSFPVNAPPFEEMMAADKFWLPKIFKGEEIFFKAKMKNHQRELVGEVEVWQVNPFCLRYNADPQKWIRK